MIEVGDAIALASIAVPLTALILRYKRGGGDGDYVTEREFDKSQSELGTALSEIRASIRDLEGLVRSRL